MTDDLTTLLYYATVFAGLSAAALAIASATVPGLWEDIKTEWSLK